MSSSSDIIDSVIPFTPGWSRSSGLKNLLKVLEKGLVSLYENIHHVYRGNDNNGFPPYLLTTAGVYEYDIKAANLSCGELDYTLNGTSFVFTARRVTKVFTDVTSGRNDYNHTWVGQPYLYAISPYATKTERLYVANVTVDSVPGFKGTAPKVIFQEDPGTTTDKYFCEIELGPPSLLSESIELPIPIEFEEALEDFVIGYVQNRESGRESEKFNKFESHWKPKFSNLWGGATNVRPKETLLRTC